MTSFIRESDNPLHPARFQHLAERIFGINSVGVSIVNRILHL
jgi:hypothetical protein